MANLSNYPVLRGLHSKFVSNLKIVCVFGVNGSEVLLVTKEDEVYAFGDNRNGCLGLSFFNRITEPTRVDSLCNKGIVKIAYGLCHTLALTTGGELYSWGDNSYGQCCHGKDTQKPSTPRTAKRQNSGGYNGPQVINDWIKKPIRDITCGAFHTLILCQSGQLFTSGYNRFGQVGNGYNCDQFTPINVSLNGGPDTDNIVAIAAGYYHSLALTETGRVYSWGKNNCGQLGIDRTDEPIVSIGSTKSLNRLSSQSNGGFCATPTLINGLENVFIKKIVCGSNHNILLSNDFDVYTFGDNSFGQIGTESDAKQQPMAAKIYTGDERLKFVDIAASFYSHISIAVSQNGRRYVWGECGGEVVSVPTETAKGDISVHDLFAVYSKPQITYKAIQYFDKLSVEESIRQSFDNPNQSDLKILVDNRSIYCHKCILRIRCVYFSKLFADKSRVQEFDDDLEVLKVKEYSYGVYYSFLKYIYTDYMDIKPEDCMHLYGLATDYTEEDLRLKCFNIIKSNINYENVYEYYLRAKRLNTKELFEFCIHFANKNYQYLDAETKLKFNFIFS